MPQLLKEQMPEPQPRLQVENDLHKIAKTYRLEAHELQVRGNRAFIDGTALLDREIDAFALGNEFFRTASAIRVIVVLPVASEFRTDNELTRRIAAAGGSVMRSPNGMDFLRFVNDYLERVKSAPIPSEPRIQARAASKLDAKTFLAPYYYSQEELKELRRAYREEDDSSSIIS